MCTLGLQFLNILKFQEAQHVIKKKNIMKNLEGIQYGRKEYQKDRN